MIGFGYALQQFPKLEMPPGQLQASKELIKSATISISAVSTSLTWSHVSRELLSCCGYSRLFVVAICGQELQPYIVSYLNRCSKLSAGLWAELEPGLSPTYEEY